MDYVWDDHRTGRAPGLKAKMSDGDHCWIRDGQNLEAQEPEDDWEGDGIVEPADMKEKKNVR